MVVGESRNELLQWLSSAFGLQYSKVEQCGTGAAYCQIMDSIYGGVAMAKVKFGDHISDYDARNNMKVLQAAFNKHKITRSIDTERLIKCRLQDNLELLQWLKRHWTENKDINVEYDASARRRGGSIIPSAERGSAGASRRGTLAGSSGNSTPVAAARVPTRAPSKGTDTNVRNVGTSASRVTSLGSASGGNSQLFLPIQRGVSAASSLQSSTQPSVFSSTVTYNQDLASEISEKNSQLASANEEILECKVMMESLETERNFYFNKLRDIEILSRKIQDQYERDDAAAETVQSLSVLDVLAEIQGILYSTEKGFEIQDPDAADLESF